LEAIRNNLVRLLHRIGYSSDWEERQLRCLKHNADAGLRQVRVFQRVKTPQADFLPGHYTGKVMDRVRFGRALGYGARHAAKTVLQAVEAAAAPAPEGHAARRPANTVEDVARTVGEAHRTVQQAQTQVRGAAVNAARAGGKSMFAPVKRFSGVLWLEVTGTFFTLIALFLSQSVWRLRAGFRLSPTAHDAQKLYIYTAIFLLFAYFAVSSFVRARRRERR
jgi:hypothetical protein